MARHASTERSRRVAAWPIVVAVVVVLIVAFGIFYFAVVDRQDKTAACTGSTVLPVTASPGAGRAVGAAALAFNATAPVARGTCVSVSVTVTAGTTAAAALAAGWRDQSTPAPGLWVVDSTADLAMVDASNSAMTAGHTNVDLATSPVVLAMRAAPAAGPVSWRGLASGAPGTPVLTLPDPRTNRASEYALESMIAASRPDGSRGAVDAASAAAAGPLFDRLAAADPTPPATTRAALTELAAGRGGFSAVPVVESELAAFNSATAVGLTAVYPTGPSAGDDILAVPLTAAWVTAAMSDAAAAFDAYLGDASGVANLTRADLRTSDPPPVVPGLDLKTKVASLADASGPARAAIVLDWTARSAPATDSSPTASSSVQPLGAISTTVKPTSATRTSAAPRPNPASSVANSSSPSTGTS